jgi:hypothetical protein
MKRAATILVMCCALALIGSPRLTYGAPGGAWDAQVRPGIWGGTDDPSRGRLLDLFIPVWGSRQHVLFFNPIGRVDNKENYEFNAGLGWRGLFWGDRAILGLNFYYDNVWTQNDNNFGQVGFGVEALSKWVDFRFNYYNPVGDTKKRITGWIDTLFSPPPSSSSRGRRRP